jgi:chemotaxis protein MotB
MARARGRRTGGNGLEAWPGYVDALSTLLMVIIFVLLVFVLAQAFMSVALSGRDQALDRVHRQLAEMTDMLSLERGRTADLSTSVAGLSHDLAAAKTTREALEARIVSLRADAAQAAAARDAATAARDTLAAQLSDAAAQARAATQRGQTLEARLAQTAAQADAAGQDAARTAAQLADARRQLAELQRQAAELDRTVRADRDTIQARLSDLAKLAEQTRALQALRDQLERQAQDAAVRATTEQERRAAVERALAAQKQLSDSAAAQIALLTQQVDGLRAQMQQVAAALQLAQTEGQAKDVQIASLDQKLNLALAAKVEELQRYRSDFFGRLREVLANRPGLQVVGDRFVFQSEVLFPTGSADLTPAGTEEIRTLAATIKQIAAEIPANLNWVLRVDGHADRKPIDGGRFASNWELSAARAITVVKLLIAEGVPAAHLAATGFADNQPLDAADTPEAYAKNRRIELRLTDR